MRKKIIFLFSALLICLFSETSFAIQIDSVKTTASPCPNNGSITVYAKSSFAPLVYSITAGPLPQPIQTSNFFNSLPPGNYTVKVSDGSGASLTANAVISGNYTTIDFTPVATPATCQGNTDATIKGNIKAGTGQGPFTWQLISPSPKTTAPQASDLFTNLSIGNYTLRITDVCGNFATKVVTVTAPNTSFLQYEPTTIKVGCDSMYVQATIAFNSEIRLPITLTFTTKLGSFTTSTFTKVDSSLLRGPLKYLYLGQIIPGITYGDYVQITAKNICGETNTKTHYIYPYNFYPSYTYVNCTDAYVGFWNTPTTYYYDGLKLPLQYSLTDIATGAVVETGTRVDNSGPAYKYSFIIPGVGFSNAVTIGKTYEFKLTDGCGQVFTKNYTIPPKGTARIVSRDIIYSPCIDSVLGCYRIETSGFASDAVLTITSGPARIGSTKPEFEHQGIYTYPITVPVSPGGYFFLYNMPIGTYNYTITDGCNNKITSSVVVKPTDVSSLSKSVTFKKGCLGKNEIYTTMNYGKSIGSSHAKITIKNINTGTILSAKTFYQTVIADATLNVPSGTYEITYEFGAGITFSRLDKVPLPCTTLRDTIIIDGYQAPEIYTGNSILCHNAITMQVVPDSSKGVAPFQFEVISGPQTFPVQNSNLFTVNSPGTYIVRIYDVCGSATAKQIYISPISSTLVPASVVRTCDELHLVYPTSVFYKYKWTRPDKTTFIKDSLVLNPITAADTGVYQIAQLVNINGCKDTLYASYHVTMSGATYYQQANICSGSSITIGSNVYNTSGVYKNTLVNRLGCDSVIFLTLNVTDYKRNTINTSICKGQSVSIGTHHYSLPGTYHDTLSTTTCDSIVTLKLSVSDLSLDLGPDKFLCNGEKLLLNAGPGFASYYWNDDFSDSLKTSIVVNKANTYWVKVKNNQGCTASDTLILNLFSLPVATIGNDTSICSGDKIQLKASGGSHYQWIPVGMTQQVIQVSPKNDIIYKVIVSDDHNCKDTASIKVQVKSVPTKSPFENNLLTYCFDNGPVEISTNWGDKFLWTSTGETTSHIQIYQAGIYEVKVFDNSGCWIKGSVTVNEYCAPALYVPSAFSPNADGANDKLEIFGKHFTDFKITIFNRWGEIIFISDDRNYQWDGNYIGAPMEIGTYPWIISYQDEYGDKKHHLKGSITLIR